MTGDPHDLDAEVEPGLDISNKIHPLKRNRVRKFLDLVMIEHSVFALPFAYIAALTAMWRETRSVHWVQLLLITIAMVSARTVAMAANRILDREFDALNPRTARRELVTGELSVRSAGLGLAAFLVIFLAAALALSPLCLVLAPIAVVVLVLYSYGKRFTDFPQALLALAQFVAPVGAWVAVTGHSSDAAVALGVAVGTWIGGFDLIYACQDVAADRADGVRSVPARFGINGALYGARAAHTVTVLLLGWYAVLTDAGWAFWLGLVVVCCAFLYEHSIVKPGDLSRLNRAFFQLNSFVGVSLFAFALLDLVLRGLGV